MSYSPYPDDNTIALKVLIQLVSCHQFADVHLKVRMAMYATLCLVSACACRGWWASSVTAVPLDSGSPSAQVTTLDHFLD